ncbi:MAG: tRNA (adenosine(37)-N6)-threonylcarbamoyltransferase complex ATPase subunit type 1 TsaE [Betaproteobacteria bacterium]
MSTLAAPILAEARWPLADDSATAAFGAALADALRAQQATIAQHGFVLWLRGDLGAGKTALVRALLRRLGVEGPVKSPTFSLVEPYVVSRLNFYHFDFYRFSQASEFDAAGFREMFGGGSICAVEWPERAAGRLPGPDLSIALYVTDPGRLANAQAVTEAGAQCLSFVRNAMPPAAPPGAA